MSTIYSGLSEEAYPDVFDLRAMPTQPQELKNGQLSEEKIKQFFQKGFLVIPEFFNKEEIDACRADVEVLVDTIANTLYDHGKLKNLHKDKGLFQRFSCIDQEFPGSNILLAKENKTTKAIRDLWSNERLLNLVEQIIGPDIVGHPVWNLRAKLPQNDVTTVPWHQDSAYLDNDSYKVLQLGAWIPLLDATRQNGCMEVISGGHLKGKMVRHTGCWGNTWYVTMDEEEAQRTLEVDMVKNKVTCPVPYGGLLIFNNLIPHRSLDNVSGDIRWSLDLRWQRADKPVGFYGLKEGVLMRKAGQRVTSIDWDSFEKVERTVAADSASRKDEEQTDRFDTIIVGPWMKKYELTHRNRHTDRLMEQDGI